MDGCSPSGRVLFLTSLNVSASWARPARLKASPSHFLQEAAPADLSYETAPRRCEARRNHLVTGHQLMGGAVAHLSCCQSHTMSKSPMPAQAGLTGLVPTVRTWLCLVQLLPRSSLQAG